MKTTLRYKHRNISYKNARRLEKLFTKEYREQTETGVIYGVRFRTLQINSSIANNFVLQTAMIYGAVVLMVICLTVLSLQQLLDAGQYKYRFSVLRKLGVEENHIGLHSNRIGRDFSLYRISCIVVTDWSNNSDFATLIDLLFYKYMGYF